MTRHRMAITHRARGGLVVHCGSVVERPTNHYPRWIADNVSKSGVIRDGAIADITIIPRWPGGGSASSWGRRYRPGWIWQARFGLDGLDESAGCHIQAGRGALRRRRVWGRSSTVVCDLPWLGTVADRSGWGWVLSGEGGKVLDFLEKRFQNRFRWIYWRFFGIQTRGG